MRGAFSLRPVRALNRMKFQHTLSRSEYIDSINKWPMDVSARYDLGQILGRGGYATGQCAWYALC
jgi:hypothetical protein